MLQLGMGLMMTARRYEGCLRQSLLLLYDNVDTVSGPFGCVKIKNDLFPIRLEREFKLVYS